MNAESKKNNILHEHVYSKKQHLTYSRDQHYILVIQFYLKYSKFGPDGCAWLLIECIIINIEPPFNLNYI